MTHNDIVQKLWNLCDVLRDDGINYSDYVTELVLLLFMKMVHENTEAEILQRHVLPEGCRWTDLNKKSGTNLLNDYQRILFNLSTGKNSEGEQIHQDKLIAAIYQDAQTRLREPRHLEQLIKALDQIDWFSATKDGLGDLYEGLLEKNASETKSGAGQYFTPRALINSMVRCINPQLGEVIQDPAAGTAGFLVAADQFIKAQYNNLDDLSLKDKKFQVNKAFIGVELVPNTRRLALMNCLLHNIEGDDEGAVHLGNALGNVGKNLARADIILANPPFGTSKGGEASITRDDLTFDTSNKQLAFLQHIYRNLKPGGRAAVVLPDNVLFETGKGTDIRRDLMHKCNLHAILRLPTGIFYAQGVKTNVLFFSKGSITDPKAVEDCTQHTWVYDLRTNMPSFGKRTPFTNKHLDAFEDAYELLEEQDWPAQAQKEKDKKLSNTLQWLNIDGQRQLTDFAFSDNDGEELNPENSRLRCFSRDYIAETKGDSLDISWLKDKDSVDAADLPAPEVLAGEAMGELREALRELEGLMGELGVVNGR